MLRGRGKLNERIGGFRVLEKRGGKGVDGNGGDGEDNGYCNSITPKSITRKILGYRIYAKVELVWLKLPENPRNTPYPLVGRCSPVQAVRPICFGSLNFERQFCIRNVQLLVIDNNWKGS